MNSKKISRKCCGKLQRHTTTSRPSDNVTRCSGCCVSRQWPERSSPLGVSPWRRKQRRKLRRRPLRRPPRRRPDESGEPRRVLSSKGGSSARLIGTLFGDVLGSTSLFGPLTRSATSESSPTPTRSQRLSEVRRVPNEVGPRVQSLTRPATSAVVLAQPARTLWRTASDRVLRLAIGSEFHQSNSDRCRGAGSAGPAVVLLLKHP